MPGKKRKIITLNSSSDESNAKKNEFVQLTPQLASRLLYPNPVMFLVTQSAQGKRNVMTLSWLAPANNHGGLVFVIHKKRHSASNLSEHGNFTLCVAHSGQKELLLGCGKVSGSTVDKFDGSVPGLSTSGMNVKKSVRKTEVNAYASLAVDSSDDEDNEDSSAKAVGTSDFPSEDNLAPIDQSVASLKCSVIRMDDAADAGHWLVVAQIQDAAVSPGYWDGKCFAPTNPDLPGILTFLGSQRFGTVVPDAEES